ncbi:MAG TPA: dienelactone hydrolase family protein [Burkholderiales bacterium]|nr:dienelactone hydrolase family protein [Burkholderiales bacterium]
MHSHSVRIPTDTVELVGDLVVPKDSAGLVLFAHGSGSGRHSPRNVLVAEHLQGEGLATLLFDLLTESEDRQYRNRFDIALLAERLLAATRWTATEPSVSGLAIGYFGASTGAAAALYAAAAMPATKAVVSRGGRPDLAMSALPHVGAATLLIVGGSDDTVLALNRLAYAQLKGIRALEVIPEATHLFEEPGALEEVARLAADWFFRYLGPVRS